jgi:hypothetical protein
LSRPTLAAVAGTLALVALNAPDELSPVEQKVEALRFRLVRTIRLPDGLVRIWWRSQADVLASRAA